MAQLWLLAVGRTMVFGRERTEFLEAEGSGEGDLLKNEAKMS